ncbi:hypothetical protein D1614_15315 [Maribellus luteus]|uniref:Uncharacterized protein n=1 Tax=Maribellus luteus TaxID=2305463 RepID=A0A399SUS5_9BACT|nr:hypothetical protein [Maribellus luteus]RIJ47128.1 hypothetical protein D1614_15315 [Maribellus luteus]
MKFIKEYILKDFSKICSQYDKKEDFRISADSSNFEYILDELGIHNEAFDKFDLSNQNEIKEKLNGELFFLELFSNINSNLFITVEESIANKKEIITWNHENENRSPTLVFLYLLSIQNNFLKSIRKLVLSGFCYQVQILIRGYIEVADILNAFLGDKEFCLKYSKAYDVDGKINDRQIRKLYEQYIKPSKIREIINNALDSVNFNKDFVDILEPLKKDYYYNHLSNFVHGEPMSVIYDVFPYDTDLKEWDYVPHGGYSSALRYTTTHFIFWCIFPFLYNTGFLLRKHDYESKVHDSKKVKIIEYKFYVFRNLFIKYYFDLRKENNYS